MKKTIAIILTAIVATAGAVTFTIKKSKVPNVSENINIPYFIDTMMRHERYDIKQVASDSESIGSRLTKLGFTSKSGNVFDVYSAKAISVLYEVYDSIYPTHQFINYRCVNEIIKKYGLSFGSAASFICDIPSREIDSMENFKPSYIFDRNNQYPIHDLEYSMQELADMHEGYGVVNGYINDTYTKITNGRGSLGTERNLPKYAAMDMQKRPLKSTVFFMLAPASCFNVEANEKGNYGKIKDPIVLAPVEGGYIVVTAW